MEPNGETIKLNDYSKNNNANANKTTGTFDEGGTVTGDEEQLTEQTHLTEEEAEKWRKAALIVSFATIILLSILGIGFIAISIVTTSTAALGLAFDMMLDSATSIVVLWRYFQARTVYVQEKERRAIIVLGMLFIVFSLVISIKSVVALLTSTSPSQESILAGVSTVAAVIMTSLAAVKFVIAKKLQSKSVLSDAFSSAMGAVISYGILIGAIIYANIDVAYLDSIIGIAVAVMLAGWGIWMLVTEIRNVV
ncbi:transmembrane protein 163a-like [Ptychodera flava]|uniref:transmembrane protein 163a-like n=1 Tax=Ptychodera flava TaxID=63121 RepID=UPI00396A0126